MSARRRHPAVTAAADQAKAAAADITRRVLAGYRLNAELEARATGGPMPPTGERLGPPTGPRATILEGVARRLAAGDLSACPHALAELSPGLARRSGARPEALLWVSWHPDLIACPACAATLAHVSLEEDYRCDGCGHVYPPGSPLEADSYVVPSNAEHAAQAGRLAPPLICSFGLCPRCSRASGGR